MNDMYDIASMIYRLDVIRHELDEPVEGGRNMLSQKNIVNRVSEALSKVDDARVALRNALSIIISTSDKIKEVEEVKHYFEDVDAPVVGMENYVVKILKDKLLIKRKRDETYLVYERG